MFSKILNPERYHGHHARPPFFEGWYYKIVDASTTHRYAIIPGVFLSGKPHAFIQVLNGRSGETWYHEYPLSQFWAATDRFEVHIGPNRFNANTVSLNIDRPDQKIFGELQFGGLTPWPKTAVSPGIMGWYSWVPTMECYHGIVSLDHTIYGELDIDGETAVFTNGRGYIEKDWGKSFPEGWIWLQTNHFNQPGNALTASIAKIPWRHTAFIGFIVGFYCQGKLFRFATYTGAKVDHLELSDSQLSWKMSDRHHALHIIARRGEASEFGLLKGPTTVEMGKRVAESLTAEAKVILTKKESHRESVIFVGNGRFGGLEIQNEHLLIEPSS